MLLYVFVPLAFYSCHNPAPKLSEGLWKQGLEQYRKQKDNEFAGGANSPFALLEGEFTGLKYYEPDYKWYTTGVFKSHTSKRRNITDSKGDIRVLLELGNYIFEMNGRKFSLPVFTEKGHEEGLFIMFKDLTNGDETYGGGRYIELPKPDDMNDLMLDFNYAFQPYCHYNHNYACPLVPKDCFLDIAVRAGEKKYE